LERNEHFPEENIVTREIESWRVFEDTEEEKNIP
jgi:hypothetical protein